MKIADKILSKIDEFQTLPTVYGAMTEVMSNPYSSANDVADIISSDQAAAAKILRAANSPIYGFAGSIDTVNKAIMYMGFAEVKNLVAAISIVDVFSRSKIGAYFNPVEFWKYSLAVGVISRFIAQHINAPAVEHYFLSGILHDIGKLLLYQCAPTEFAYSLQVAGYRNCSLRATLMETIGVSHNVLGELLAEKWKIPESIRHVIRHYNADISITTDRQLVSTVHIAAIVAQMYEWGSASESIISEPDTYAWNMLQLDDGFFTAKYNEIEQNYRDTLLALQL